MDSFNSLIFGLGIFFLGLRLVGDNLKGLAGGGLRAAIARGTGNPGSAAVVGLTAGALMQSATAVTFICVSMVLAGFLSVVAAAVVIVWSNVGLTAMAFVATLPIDPLVALVIGGAGIVLGVVRVRIWQTAASVLLGVGLILYGLHEMSAGAAPLREESWFHAGLRIAVSSPPLAFCAGILAAAILQSNTGATMMLITLATAGAIEFEDAALMIYGTNLGAIALRLLLASGMKGMGLRLVRLEDFFCLASGLLMMGLYYLERAGIPLVFAAADAIAHSESSRLAVVFLLSNLLPAVVMMPFLGLSLGWLERLWPGGKAATLGDPTYLHPQALGDPASAIDLIRRELAGLLRLIPTSPEDRKPSEDPEGSPPEGFVKLARTIEDFSVRLSTRTQPGEQEVSALYNLRAELSAIRHLEECARLFVLRSESAKKVPAEARTLLAQQVKDWLSRSANALDAEDREAATALRAEVKPRGNVITDLRKKYDKACGSEAGLDAAALFEDFLFVAHAAKRLAESIVKPGSNLEKAR